MRLTQVLRAGGNQPGKFTYLGEWGAFPTLPQKGIVHYGISHNRQNPLAGTSKAAVFNTFRRTRNQIVYWAVPLLIAYETMEWAIERNHFLNSKEGRALYAEEAE